MKKNMKVACVPVFGEFSSLVFVTVSSSIYKSHIFPHNSMEQGCVEHSFYTNIVLLLTPLICLLWCMIVMLAEDYMHHHHVCLCDYVYMKFYLYLCLNTVSHEAVLSRMCWLPFGYDSITVDSRGGIYDLCSDGLTQLTVLRNAVQVEAAEIRYAIIGKGPFQLPPNYQLGSFVVYVYYNPEEITTPVTLSLPTWYGGDVVPGEPPPDGLSFAVAPHTLGLRDTQYTFQLIDGGEFHDNRVHDVSIDGHSSLFTVVLKEGVKSLYLATHLMFKTDDEKTTHNIYVTYYSPTWIEVSYFWREGCLARWHLMDKFNGII